MIGRAKQFMRLTYPAAFKILSLSVSVTFAFALRLKFACALRHLSD